MHRLHAAALALLLVLAGCDTSDPTAASSSSSPDPAAADPAATDPDDAWPHYGRDAGGQRWSPLDEIAPDNVHRLDVAWVHHSGDVADGKPPFGTTSAYEVTPLLVEGTLYLCTPFNRVLALDPTTGRERWAFDPEIDRSLRLPNQFVCRGVAAWRDPASPSSASPAAAAADGPCALRILTATNDARLFALDGRTGTACPGFGEAGAVDLTRGVGGMDYPGEYHVTSPPVVVGDVVVVGSAVADNQRRDAPAGVVRGYDVRTGALRWAWDPAPRRDMEGLGYTPGTPNVWAPMSADPERDLVFLPTGNASPDYWSAVRGPLDTYASSVVALRASTGELVWHFQTVHHDVWDFDVPAQPTLTTLHRDGEAVPVVVQATKMGLVFVLHRETGEPFHPVEERPVPQGGAPGERLSPTQPFPVRPPPLVRHDLPPGEAAWGITPWDRRRCRQKLEALRYEGIYTPPTLEGEGSLMFPGNAGGVNWGGVAVDPGRGWMVANANELPWRVQLFPADRYTAMRAAHPGVEVSPMRGAPFGMLRELVVSPLGVPCTPPPWGTLSLMDLEAGTIRWQVPLGTVRDLAPVPLPIPWGTPTLGGPLVTGSGLVFIGAAMDDYLRAFDLETGEALWQGRLPAGGQATPMTYRAGGRQFVVIAAGGHGRGGTRLGDALVAFALPDPRR